MTVNPYARFDLRDRPFPKKVKTLPAINDIRADTPISLTPNENNQIMPYPAPSSLAKPAVGASSSDKTISKSMDSDSGGAGRDRLRQLESRLNVGEKSNRALLDEVVRLQSELKNMTRQNEEALRGEREARRQLEKSLRESSDMVAQQAAHLNRTDEKVQEDKAALAALQGQTRNMEKSLVGQQNANDNKEQLKKIQELKGELDEAVRTKDRLEKITFQLAEELRQVKARLDSQATDFASVANELKGRSKKVEEDARQTKFDTQKIQTEAKSHADTATTQLRGQLEARLTELRDVLGDLRLKQDQEATNRRALEQQLQLRLTDLQAAIGEQNRKREEAMQYIDMKMREKDHLAETERIKLQGKVAEVAEEVTRKVMQKDMKLRNETLGKYEDLEKQLQAEKEAREKFERGFKDKLSSAQQSQPKSSRNSHEDELNDLLAQIKNEKKLSHDMLVKLTDAVNLVEREQEEQKKQLDKVLTAEIKSRKQHEQNIDGKLKEVDEKLNAAKTAVKQAGSMGNSGSKGGDWKPHIDKANAEREELKRKLQEHIDEQTQLRAEDEETRRQLQDTLDSHHGNTTKALGDLDSRHEAINKKLAKLEKSLANKPTFVAPPESRANVESAGSKGQELADLQEKIIDIDQWRDTLEKSLKNYKRDQEGLPDQVSALEERCRKLKIDLDYRLVKLGEEREKDMDALKSEIARLKKKTDSAITQDDIDPSKLKSDSSQGAGPKAQQLADLEDKVDNLHKWRDDTEKMLKNQKRDQESIPEQLAALEERYKKLKSELDNKVGRSGGNRDEDIESLKADLARLKKRTDAALTQDDIDPPTVKKHLEECQTGLRKVGESIHTVKTALGLKIQSEKELRSHAVKGLQDQFDDLSRLVDRMKDAFEEANQDDGDEPGANPNNDRGRGQGRGRDGRNDRRSSQGTGYGSAGNGRNNNQGRDDKGGYKGNDVRGGHDAGNGTQRGGDGYNGNGGRGRKESQAGYDDDRNQQRGRGRNNQGGYDNSRNGRNGYDGTGDDQDGYYGNQ